LIRDIQVRSFLCLLIARLTSHWSASGVRRFPSLVRYGLRESSPLLSYDGSEALVKKFSTFIDNLSSAIGDNEYVDTQPIAGGKILTQLLLVDDDLALGPLLAEFFGSDEFRISIASTGEEAVAIIAKQVFSLVILDVMLPGMDGFRVLREIRRETDMPVLMLTTRGATRDRVQGLEVGADDYLSKPFQPEELLARVRSILRRTQPRSGKMKYLAIGDIELDERARRVKLSGVDVDLTGAEFVLLQFLVSHAGSVYSRDRLVQIVFERGPTMFDRSIDSLISNLRKKLGSHTDGSDRLRSVRGVGYAYVAENVKGGGV